MVALISASKLALSFLPQVEVITSLFIVFTLCFGWRNTFIAAILFVFIEIAIFGFMISWVVLYFIYWPLLVTVTHLISWGFKHRDAKLNDGKIKRKTTKVTFVVAITSGVLMTIFFGALSAVLDMVFMGAIGTGQFWEFVFWRYVAGTWFFAVHIVANIVALPILVPTLTKAIERIKY